MVSHYLLSSILHPIGVTDDFATIIDNIFSNITNLKTKSGNIINFVKLATIICRLLILILLYFILQNVTFRISMKPSLLKILSTMDLHIFHDNNASVNEKFNCISNNFHISPDLSNFFHFPPDFSIFSIFPIFSLMT